MKLYLKKSLSILSFGFLFAFFLSACSLLPKQNTVPDAADGTRTLVHSGTLHISGRSYALLVNGAWGTGLLHYKGKKYQIKAKSIGLGYALGIKHISIKGTVYNLKTLNHINGKYTGLKAGITIGKGIAASNITNSHDVVLSLSTKSKGVAVDVGAGLASLQIQLTSPKPVK
ncbi:hypothetical protein MNBD_GAMMA12-1089 [hydrothermal vent metagenome]|uniref:Lipoprotein n=1 Tax=hydrothermal vent metagenome TaxID=652676 RepID=A0A3B0Z6D1_9ZZZZ